MELRSIANLPCLVNLALCLLMWLRLIYYLLMIIQQIKWEKINHCSLLNYSAVLTGMNLYLIYTAKTMQWYFTFDYSVSVPGHVQTWKKRKYRFICIFFLFIYLYYLHVFKQGQEVQPAPGPANPSYGPLGLREKWTAHICKHKSIISYKIVYAFYSGLLGSESRLQYNEIKWMFPL